MSLRQRKQRQQRLAILENAIALFRERGVEAVRAADIAARCDISEATFFNYFGGKDALLREWASDLLDHELARVARRMGQGGNLRRAMRVAVGGLAEQVASEPALHTAAWTRLGAAHPDPVSWGARGRSDRPDPAVEMVVHAQEQGECRADVPAEQLAGLLRAVLATTLASWLAVAEAERRPPLDDRLVKACDLLLDGFRKRNERVRHGGASA